MTLMSSMTHPYDSVSLFMTHYAAGNHFSFFFCSQTKYPICLHKLDGSIEKNGHMTRIMGHTTHHDSLWLIWLMTRMNRDIGKSPKYLNIQQIGGTMGCGHMVMMGHMSIAIRPWGYSFFEALRTFPSNYSLNCLFRFYRSGLLSAKSQNFRIQHFRIWPTSTHNPQQASTCFVNSFVAWGPRARGDTSPALWTLQGRGTFFWPNLLRKVFYFLTYQADFINMQSPTCPDGTLTVWAWMVNPPGRR